YFWGVTLSCGFTTIIGLVVILYNCYCSAFATEVSGAGSNDSTLNFGVDIVYRGRDVEICSSSSILSPSSLKDSDSALDEEVIRSRDERARFSQ
ncbi:hypothetical protein HAX54_038644, partial [Datura stramonium]|nr:hypothetical protein [Datura stramonium]